MGRDWVCSSSGSDSEVGTPYTFADLGIPSGGGGPTVNTSNDSESQVNMEDISEIIAILENRVAELGLNLDPDQTTFLLNNGEIYATIRDFLDEFSSLKARKGLVRQSINELMTYTSSNFPGKVEGLPFEWWLDDNFFDTQDNFIQELWKEWKKLTKKEKKWTKIFPGEALKIRENKTIAFTKTTAIYGNIPQQLNGKPDAFRHAFFNAINTRDVGDIVTLIFSSAHESEVPLRWILEREMDLYNNIIGIAIGDEAASNATDLHISNEVMQALNNSELRYLSPINYSDPNFLDDPSTSELGDGTHGISTSTRLIPTTP